MRFIGPGDVLTITFGAIPRETTVDLNGKRIHGLRHLTVDLEANLTPIIDMKVAVVPVTREEESNAAPQHPL